VSDLLDRVRRGGALAGAVAAVIVLVAALPWLRGHDPARSVLRARLDERELDPAALAAVRAELELAANPLRGAVDWLVAAATGDFGTSWVKGTPVLELLLPAVGVSAVLAVAAMSVAVVVTLILVAPGVWAASGACRPPGPAVRGIRVLGAVVAALPEFALAALLTLLAVHWRLLPVTGWFGASHLVLPALALGVPTGGLLARVVGVAVDATAGEPWVRTWRAVDCGRPTLTMAITWRAGTVAVPQVAMLFVGVLGGTVAVEELFAVPGVGRLALQAALAQDLPVLQACVALLVLAAAAVGAAGIVAQRAMLGPASTAAGLVPAPPANHPFRWRIPVLAGAVLTAWIMIGLLRDPEQVRLDQRLSGPSWAHPLGTDPVGRDVLAQFGHGAVLTICTAGAVAALGLVVGLALGLRRSAARVGGADLLNALPFVLVGLVVAAVAGPGLHSAAAAVVLVAWAPVAVHTRSLAAEVRASGYYEAAVLAGAGPGWLLRRHLLPAVLGPVLVYAATRLPSTAHAVAALGFLGLAASHDTPEWGAQLATAVDYLERAPAAAAAPLLGLALLGVLAGSVPAELRPGVAWPRRRPGAASKQVR
jgi:peptide/nickel transport system permease protein